MMKKFVVFALFGLILISCASVNASKQENTIPEKDAKIDENTMTSVNSDETVSSNNNSVEASNEIVEAQEVLQPDEELGAQDATEPDEEDIGDLIRCESSIEFEGSSYAARALGPTIEEAIDNSIEEACADPCADKLPDSVQESEREEMLDACIEACSGDTRPSSVHCVQHGELIYSEGN